VSERFAIYYTFEPEDPIYQLASSWLGYDLWSGKEISQSNSPLFDENLTSFLAQTTNPRQYGFHATLKPPFRLKQGKSLIELDQALQSFSREMSTFECEPLTIQKLGQFIALRSEKHCQKLNKLAEQCVIKFDHFRAPLNQVEIKKRKPEQLSEPQKNNLEQWGYPFVCGEFQFHMTLTNRLRDSEREEIFNYLKNIFSSVLGKPLVINKICLCHQSESDYKFRVINQYPLANLKPEL